MQFGVIFPHEAVAHRRDALRLFVGVVEDAGIDYLVGYDHVLGADTSTRPDWIGPYNSQNSLHELFVLFAFLSGITNLELVTGVLVLPQRQTALVAKQVADLDLLLEGRLRLGVASGWNGVEFQALGEDFKTRGARLEEQVEVLRLLWSGETVSYSGRFHTIDRASINPPPFQRPVPIWFGGAGRQFARTASNRTAVLERIGRIGDGWIAGAAPVEVLRESWAAICAAAERAGRNPAELGLQVLAQVDSPQDFADLGRSIAEWRAIGVTHVSFSLSRRSQEFETFREQLEAVQAVLDTEVRGSG